MRYRWDPAYPNHAADRRRGPSLDGHLRASDAERSEVAERLSHHYTEGRLDQAEFGSRMDRAVGAVTRGDLDGLFDDLPEESVVSGRPPSRRAFPRQLARAVAVLLLVSLIAGWVASLGNAPWVLLVLVGLYLWHRSGRRDGGLRARHELRR